MHDTTEFKPWVLMSPVERDRLISGKGGRILAAKEQRVLHVKGATKNVARFDTVTYVDGVLEFQVGEKYGMVEVAVIGTKLSKAQVRALVADLGPFA